MRLIDYVNQGGAIMYILLVMNVLGLSLILWRLFSLSRFKKAVDKAASALAAEIRGQIQLTQASAEVVRDMVSHRTHQLEFGLNVVRIIAGVAPLLGLLGTVIGIQGAFENISGSENISPTQFSGNLSMALLTTIGGLIVAIPHFIGHSYLSGMLDDIDKQLTHRVLTVLFGNKKD